MASKEATHFVREVVTMTAVPGTRAALRAGLTLNPQQMDRTMHAYLARLAPSNRPHRAAVYYTVASLIAHNPTDAIPKQAPGNLGASFGHATALTSTTREATLHLLTRQSTKHLCRTLIRAILPLRTQRPVDIDFARLIDDAARWPTSRQTIGRTWLLSFYRAKDNSTEDIDAPVQDGGDTSIDAD